MAENKYEVTIKISAARLTRAEKEEKMADDVNKPVDEPVEEPTQEPEEQPQEEASQTPEAPQEEPQEPSQPEEEPSPATSPEPPSEEPQEPEEPKMSRRKAKRLEKLEGLIERLRPPGQQPESKPEKGIDYREMIDAPTEVYSDLEKASQDYGQQQYNRGLEQAKTLQFHTRLEIDAPRVEAKYPIFNKESSEFNPAVANSINEWFLASVGYDPKADTVANVNVRYADFVEGIMELADNMAGVQTAKSTQNIAKQAASTGLRPDGSSPKRLDLSKAPEDMSEEELNAAIGATLPRDARGRFTSQS